MDGSNNNDGVLDSQECIPPTNYIIREGINIANLAGPPRLASQQATNLRANFDRATEDDQVVVDAVAVGVPGAAVAEEPDLGLGKAKRNRISIANKPFYCGRELFLK